MTHARAGEVSLLLEAWGAGEASALDELLPLVYGELRRLAAAQLRAERPDHTLQPTALVNEAFLRLVGGSRISYRSRAHFLAVAARAMRRVLVDHARRRTARKRGDGREAVPLESVQPVAIAPARDLLELHRLLDELESLDERAARVLEQRYFAGATVAETAESLGLSEATIYRETKFAMAWLRRRIEEAP